MAFCGMISTAAISTAARYVICMPGEYDMLKFCLGVRRATIPFINSA
jgi:hypothetical protein